LIENLHLRIPPLAELLTNFFTIAIDSFLSLKPSAQHRKSLVNIPIIDVSINGIPCQRLVLPKINGKIFLSNIFYRGTKKPT